MFRSWGLNIKSVVYYLVWFMVSPSGACATGKHEHKFMALTMAIALTHTQSPLSAFSVFPSTASRKTPA